MYAKWISFGYSSIDPKRQLLFHNWFARDRSDRNFLNDPHCCTICAKLTYETIKRLLNDFLMRILLKVVAQINTIKIKSWITILIRWFANRYYGTIPPSDVFTMYYYSVNYSVVSVRLGGVLFESYVCSKFVKIPEEYSETFRARLSPCGWQPELTSITRTVSTKWLSLLNRFIDSYGELKIINLLDVQKGEKRKKCFQLWGKLLKVPEKYVNALVKNKRKKTYICTKIWNW